MCCIVEALRIKFERFWEVIGIMVITKYGYTNHIAHTDRYYMTITDIKFRGFRANAGIKGDDGDQAYRF